MRRSKTLLFISYGGAHAFILMPLLKRAIDLGYTTKVIGLTTAIELYKKNGFECLSAKNFIHKQDSEILKYGEFLFENMDQDKCLVDKEETIAYLGLSFYDLVQKYKSFDKALTEYKLAGRAIFEPKTLVRRIFQSIKTDCLITTNSHRTEKEAVKLAKEQDIPTLQIPDLFCHFERYKLDADYICVVDDTAKNNLVVKYGVEKSKIHITGNPDFDKFIHLRQKLTDLKIQKIKASLNLNGNKKYLLWNDQLTILTGDAFTHIERDETTTFRNLDNISNQLKDLDYGLLVKCHSSQDENHFRRWCDQNNACFVENHKFLEYLQVVDIVMGFSSTILVGAYNSGKPVIVLNQTGEKSFLPILHYDGIEEIGSPSELPDVITTMQKTQTITNSFGNGDAVEKIIKLINDILEL